MLVPGLLAAGVGSLIFIGLNSWTGFGDFSLAVPDIPTFTTPDVAEFFWAVGIGIAAAVLGSGIRRLALLLQPVVERRMVLLTPVAGMAVAGLAIVFGEWSDESASQVLFSGQNALPGLIEQAESWTVGALVLLVVCKSLAYGVFAQRLPRRPDLPRHVHRRGPSTRRPRGASTLGRGTPCTSRG